ncbi:hypothetical protein [Terriglobus aquaticus]|uniref:Uncharacterized protein n=1 Tax=Terriglobus aquaticus TaxID=940139 RepID=A0ABW9KNE5_9BACT|nr:hypothetical protein [Terriglobus aquaticus]
MNVPNADRLAVRWTIGSVRDRGFEMLRLSIHCATRLFGPEAEYLVCVNELTVEEARRRTGSVPDHVQWQAVTRADLAPQLATWLGNGEHGYIEGMGWKLAPLRTFPDRYELAIDNDVILWDLPAGMRQWLSEPASYLFAEDADRCFGAFDPQLDSAIKTLGVRGLNAGVRGLPPGIDLGQALTLALTQADSDARRLTCKPLDLSGEIEEQGLQAAAMARLPELHGGTLHLVRLAEVNLSSPFWPKTPNFGTCGAHFIGMNARHIPWDYFDRPADDWLAEHWARSRPTLYDRAELALPS